MSTRSPIWPAVRLGFAGLCASFSLSAFTIPAVAQPFGRSATPSELAGYDIDVKPNGEGLPPGSGTVRIGAEIYQAKCASCHGATGTEGPRDRLVGGRGSLASDRPIKTVGSYWEYAPTIFDYVQRAMPFTAPGSLTADEVYSLVAFLLNRNGIVDESTTLDKATLPKITMPNSKGFVTEPEFRHVKRAP